MLKNKKLLNALALKQQEIPPIWLMRQAGRYMPSYQEVRKKAGSFMQLCKKPEFACEVTLQPIDQFDLDAAIIFSDILTIPEAMDINLKFHEGQGPIIHKPIRNIQDVLTRAEMSSDISYVFDAIRMTKRALNNRVPLIGFTGSPWTLACYMVEGKISKNLQNIKILAHTQPETLQQLICKLENIVIDYCKNQIKAGADVIMIFDSWGGLLGYDDFFKWSYHSMQKITAALETPSIVFSKPCTPWLLDMAKLACSGIGIDYTCDINYAKMILAGKKAIQGNLDPYLLLGNKQDLEQATKKLLSTMKDVPGFIFNLGHGILKQTNPNTINHLVDMVREKC